MDGDALRLRIKGRLWLSHACWQEKLYDHCRILVIIWKYVRNLQLTTDQIFIQDC